MAYDQCLLFEGDAASFVLGDVPAERRAEMVTHIDGCSACRRDVAALAGALDSISAAVAPRSPRAGFVERVIAAADSVVPEAADDRMSLSALAHPARPVAVVVRRRRTLLALTVMTLLLTAMGAGWHAWTFLALAAWSALVTVTYLALVIRITHTKAKNDLTLAFRVGEISDDAYWRELGPELIVDSCIDDLPARQVVAVDNTALIHFVLAYFAGWALTPLVVLIRLTRGDLAGIEQSPWLARIVALQRRGRAQSFKLLIAGATTVAVAGGGTAASIVLTSGIASAATAQTYTVNVGDTLSAIAARYGMSASYLAQLNGISNPNFIIPGEVIKLVGEPVAGSSGAGATYTVRAGDTLEAIATRFGATVAELTSINHLSDPNLIYAGQTLQLAPAAGAGPSGPVATGTYQVQPGDTLAGIAARFGTTVANLAATNHIPDPNLIEVGQILSLRGGTAPSAAPSAPPAVTTSAPSSAGYVNPFGYGSWSPSRIDEGVDWIPNVTSPVVAIGEGVITYSSMSSGWPGGGFITYRLTSGSHAGLYIYVAEHITDLLPVGTVVSPGQRIATAPPGYPWTEWGWASPSGPEPAPSSQYNGAPDGTSTAGGKAFARFLISLGATGIENPGPGPTSP